MPSRIPTLDEVSAPLIGFRYRVPCIRAARSGFDRYQWWPVIGVKHSDPDLGVRDEHFHYDWRFIHDDRIRDYFSEKSVADPARLLGQIATFFTGEVRPKILTCVRQMPEFPTMRPVQCDLIPWLADLERRYAGARLKCRTCPHRGTPLDGLPVDDRGRVVCPAHGLRWHLETGELCARLKAKRPAEGPTP